MAASEIDRQPQNRKARKAKVWKAQKQGEYNISDSAGKRRGPRPATRPLPLLIDFMRV